MVEVQRRILGKLRPVRPLLLTGTDFGSYPFLVPGRALHEEMALLGTAGWSPPEILRAATLEAARAMRRGEEMGRVRVGLRADLILVDGDPLRSLEPLRRPRGVMVRGLWLDEDALDRLREAVAAAFRPDVPTKPPSAEELDALESAVQELEATGAVLPGHLLAAFREATEILRRLAKEEVEA